MHLKDHHSTSVFMAGITLTCIINENGVKIWSEESKGHNSPWQFRDNYNFKNNVNILAPLFVTAVCIRYCDYHPVILTLTCDTILLVHYLAKTFISII